MAGFALRVRIDNRIPQAKRKVVDGVQGTLAGAAQVAKAVARDKVPVDTGALKASIEVWSQAKGFKIGSKLDYAAIIEFGGVNRVPQPYLRPAALAAQIYAKTGTFRLAKELSREYS